MPRQVQRSGRRHEERTRRRTPGRTRSPTRAPGADEPRPPAGPASQAGRDVQALGAAPAPPSVASSSAAPDVGAVHRTAAPSAEARGRGTARRRPPVARAHRGRRRASSQRPGRGPAATPASRAQRGPRCGRLRPPRRASSSPAGAAAGGAGVTGRRYRRSHGHGPDGRDVARRQRPVRTSRSPRHPARHRVPARRVLRPGDRRSRAGADDHPDTAAFAARDARPARSSAPRSSTPAACPWRARPAGRLAPAGHGDRGRACAARASVPGSWPRRSTTSPAEGGELVWCNARTPARRFYERAGFVAHGDEWDEPEIGPHVAMSRGSCARRPSLAPVRWTVHGEREIYDSEWMRLVLVDVEVPGGDRFDHHVVRFPTRRPGTVVHDPERGVLLLWRHRFITDTWGWEIPAGRIEPGETPERGRRPRGATRRPAGGPARCAPLGAYAPINGSDATSSSTCSWRRAPPTSATRSTPARASGSSGAASTEVRGADRRRARSTTGCR